MESDVFIVARNILFRIPAKLSIIWFYSNRFKKPLFATFFNSTALKFTTNSQSADKVLYIPANYADTKLLNDGINSSTLAGITE